MIEFVSQYKSLALLLLSTVLTGVIMEPGTLITHLINLLVLVGTRVYMQNSDDFKVPAVGILVSVGLTAVATYPTEYRIIVEIINFFILCAMWHVVKLEKASPTAR